MNNIKKFDTFNKINEAFDWENYDDTDLAGPAWDMQCGELVENFVKVLDSAFEDVSSKKGALNALVVLFQNQIEEAKKKLK